MPVTIITNSSDFTGTNDNDAIVAVASGGTQTIDGGDGHDTIVAGLPFVFADDTSANGSRATATNIDNAAWWSTADSPMVADSSIPYISIFRTATTPVHSDWFSVTLDVGQTITVDVDLASGGFLSHSDLAARLTDAAGTQLAFDGDSTMSEGGGGSISIDFGDDDTSDPYLTFTAFAAGTYFINIGGEIDGNTTTLSSISGDRTYLANVSVTGHAASAVTNVNDMTIIDGGEENGRDNLYGTNGVDRIVGNRERDYLFGFGGDDYLIGGNHEDYIDGGDGFDWASYEDAFFLGVIVSLAITGPQQTQSAGEDILVGIEGLVGSVDGDTLTGNDEVNFFRGLGGSDTLNGGLGNDTFEILDGTGFDQLNGGGDTDTADMSASAFSWTIDFLNSVFGNTNGDTIGISSVERFIGTAQNDVFGPVGAAGPLELFGGDGDDVFLGTNEGRIEGGSGFDLIDFTGLGLVGDYEFDLELGFDSRGTDIFGIEHVTTGDTDDELYGDGAANRFSGGAGADILVGRGGNDVLNGGADNDTLDGGEGFDFASYVDAPSAVFVSLETSTPQDTGGAGMDGLFAIEALIGSEHGDSLTGNDFDNWFEGKGGNDTVVGGLGNDTFFWEQGGGDDNFDGGDSTAGDILYLLRATSGWTVNLGTGIATNDLDGSVALTSVEQVYGSDHGDDLAASFAGGSTLFGFGGDDVIRVSNSLPNTAFGGTGVDTLDTTAVIGVGLGYVIDLAAGTTNFGETVAEFENLVSGETDDAVTGTDGDNVIETHSGSDSLSGLAGNDVLDGGLGADQMSGGADNDTYVVDDAGDVVTENADEGTDLVQASISYVLGADVENLTLTGSANLTGDGNALANAITGNSGANTLTGLAGNDVLDGGLGADQMYGGADSDTYVVDNAGDMLTENADQGTDLVQAAISYVLGANVENLTLIGIGNTNGTGNALVNLLTGNAGANVLDGKGGADTMAGLGGNDFYYADNALDVVIEGAAEGAADRVFASVSYTLGAGVHVERLTTSSNTATTAINLTGNELANQISGNAGINVLSGGGGNDVLDGGLGADQMYGGADNDTYVVDIVGDLVTENADEGTDLVQAAISYVLGADVENLTLTGSAGLTGDGNALANALTGNAGINTLNGLAGDDVLDGRQDADTMTGAGGDDTYHVDNAGDNVIENSAANGTNDRILSSVSYSLTGRFVEVLTLTGGSNINGTGNGQVNTLVGNAGANTLLGLQGTDTLDGGGGNDVLDGGLDADTMTGAAGDDTYYVDHAGDNVIESSTGNGTNDRILSSVSYNLAGRYVEVLTLTGSANINGTGNSLAQTINGNDGANTLQGLQGNDTLNGLAGNDVLDGGQDADTMTGAGGDDTYYVDNAGDNVIESSAGNGTNDRILSSVSYSLTGRHVEVLTLTGSGAINGTGNGQVNTLVGNAGANTLLGMQGTDTLDGGGGNDVLDGGLDADTMTGAGGDDTYYVDNAGDNVIESSASNGINDQILSSVSYNLTGRYVEVLTLTGSGAINGTGNGQANTLVGNAGANVLDGGGKADMLTGGAGADSFQFSSALGGGNIDAITDYSVPDDRIVLDDAIFTGLAAGALAAGAFNIGTAATQADDRVIYNAATGALLFDVDGLGGAAAVQFATVGAGLPLTSAEFLVI